jgi:hypothetical protein
MKIIENFNPDGVPLYDIKHGDIFSYNGSYFMRCKDDGKTLNYNDNKNKDKCITVDLSTGNLEWVQQNTIVPPIYARIRINGRAD